MGANPALPDIAHDAAGTNAAPSIGRQEECTTTQQAIKEPVGGLVSVGGGGGAPVADFNHHKIVHGPPARVCET